MKRYTSLFKKYHKRYKQTNVRKIVLDLAIFTASTGRIAGSIVTGASVIALMTAGGLLFTKLAEALKYNEKFVMLKKINKELRLVINELQVFKRGNTFEQEKVLTHANQVDGIIAEVVGEL